MFLFFVSRLIYLMNGSFVRDVSGHLDAHNSVHSARPEFSTGTMSLSFPVRRILPEIPLPLRIARAINAAGRMGNARKDAGPSRSALANMGVRVDNG
jgi:hypothetical protein